MASVEDAFIYSQLQQVGNWPRTCGAISLAAVFDGARKRTIFWEKRERVLKEGQPDLRRHPRVQASWPVTVEIEGEAFQVETLNLSPLGAKLAADDLPLKLGAPALLHIHPPEGDPLDVQAILWRIDPDGPVFFFIGLSRGLFSTEAS